MVRQSAAKTRSRGEAVARRGRNVGLWWAAIVALALVTTLNPFVTALVLVGMAPAITAWLTAAPGQPHLAPCIGYLGLAGVLPMVWNLWQVGPSAEALVRFLSDPFVWLAMYGSAAVGWLIYLMAPPIHETLFEMRLDRMRRRLVRRQERLVEDWGPQADPDYREERSETAGTGAALK